MPINYSEDEKIKAVFDYLNHTSSFREIAAKHGIKSEWTLNTWVRNYQHHGMKSFKKRENPGYLDGEYKLEVLEWCKRTENSFVAAARHFNISNSVIHKWNQKLELFGPQALFQTRRRPSMSKKSKHKDTNDKSSVNDESEELAKLRRELHLVRIENDYLKKLKALIQENQDLENDKHK